MLTPEVIALADQVRAHLEQGDLAGLGPIDLGSDGVWDDAEHVARLVLADVAHRREVGQAFDRLVPGASWEDLAVQLGCLLRAIHRRLAEHAAPMSDQPEPQSEEAAEFRLALQGSPVTVYCQDAELRYTWLYNPQQGFSLDAVVGKTDAEIVDSEDAALLTAIKRRVLATGIRERHQLRATVGGEATYHDLTVEPLRNPVGEIIGVTGAATDITALKQAEQALAYSQAQLAEAQQLAQLGSWEWDIGKDRVSWSDELYRIWGQDRASFTATYASALDFVHPDDRSLAREVLDSAARSGQPYELEHRIVRPDGEVRHLISRGAVDLDAAGRVVRMHGTGQDVTERKRVEEERMAQRERQARLDGMLFAVKNNLATSSEALDALQPESTLPPHLHEAIAAASAALSRALADLAKLQQLIPTPPDTPHGPAPDQGEPIPEPER